MSRLIGPIGPAPIGVGTGLNGLQMAIDDLVDVAHRIPTASGETAASRAAALPTGRGAFGTSPAGELFEEMWALNADYQKGVVAELGVGLVALREALLRAASRTADAEAEAAAAFVSAATEHSSALGTSYKTFVQEHRNERAAEILAWSDGADAAFAEAVVTARAGEPANADPAGTDQPDGFAQG